MPGLYGPTDAEATALAKIHAQTGYRFRRIGGIDTNDKVVMRNVLPIVPGLIEETSDPGVKAGLKCLFASKYARAYIEYVIKYMEIEDDPVMTGVLANIATTHMDSSHAERAWLWLRPRIQTIDNGYRLAVKLLEFKSVREAVRSVILSNLESQSVSIGELRDLEKAKDAEINKALNSKTRQKGVQLPLGFKWIATTIGPDRAKEITSFEVDFEDFSGVVESLQVDHQIVISEDNAAGPLPGELNRWYSVAVSSTMQEKPQLWLRFEDEDVVEVVLAPATE